MALCRFQSTHPMRGATQHVLYQHKRDAISIHAPRAGCDDNAGAGCLPMRHFNPRTPCGVRLQPCEKVLDASSFQSTHPMRGATVCSVHSGTNQPDISIHAPHAGCDRVPTTDTPAADVFQSTHPMRGATSRRLLSGQAGQFQSTHPMRGATNGFAPAGASRIFQSTHPMRGATCKSFSAACRCTISIHAPHAGCDISKLDGLAGLLRFQSTHPMRGATHATLLQISNCTISIHAPHAGCDFTKSAIAGCARNFNPRTPCGVRHDRHGNWMLCVGKFQSTHPMRGATDPLDVSLFPR